MADASVTSFENLLDALRKRHTRFHEYGCRSSDHGLETIYAEPCSVAEARSIFEKARARRALSSDEVVKFKSALLYEFGIMDHARGWVQQFHLGALRNNNARMAARLGPDTGFDSIGDSRSRGCSLVFSIDHQTDQLAPTIFANRTRRQRRDGHHAGQFPGWSSPANAARERVVVFDQKEGIENRSAHFPTWASCRVSWALSPIRVPFVVFASRILQAPLQFPAKTLSAVFCRTIAPFSKAVQNICLQAKHYFGFEIPHDEDTPDGGAPSGNGVLP